MKGFIEFIKRLTLSNKIVLSFLYLVYIVAIILALKWETGFSLKNSIFWALVILISFSPICIFWFLRGIKDKIDKNEVFSPDILQGWLLAVLSLIISFCFLGIIDHFKGKSETEKTTIELHKEVQTIRQILETKTTKKH
ncbi:MAG: hypothetical protein PHS93_07120 [Candidatus Omnitrophica bacterium]|nr:hypothetical protein [Candidatus Omnitrophota bacterium]MDD5352912.1 hypothetical protein [Candidatus Omnitrophota bacterium]MDD5550511.1 hypothetical protein [Candidatus Omnitrophota bacterium]